MVVEMLNTLALFPIQKRAALVTLTLLYGPLVLLIIIFTGQPLVLSGNPRGKLAKNKSGMTGQVYYMTLMVLQALKWLLMVVWNLTQTG